MGMASNTEDNAQVEAEYNGLAALHRSVNALGLPLLAHFTELSMGMSGDLDQALAAGSTMVRVGTSIFGPR
jgi:uncharacterized pyridoxal phosphate-containing UPF0001 family protein